MINNNLMDELNRLGFGADIDALESYVISLQEAIIMGNPVVTNEVYNQHLKLLKELRPDSYALKRDLAGQDEYLNEYDILLSRYPVRQIINVHNMRDLEKFKDAIEDREIDLLALDEPNGHFFRAVYVNGELTTGSVKGQFRKGRDITRHLLLLLPNHIEAWERIRIVEVRGIITIPTINFEPIKHVYKIPLSAVTSFLMDTATPSEIKNLLCICNKIYVDNEEKLKFDTLWDELSYLENQGFKTPKMILIEDVTRYNLSQIIDDILEYFGELYEAKAIEYKTDGIMVQVNNYEQFKELGIDEEEVYLGNFMLRIGPHWEDNIYDSTILEIKWEPGKKYLMPKAIIEPVITVTGSTVEYVPLFNVGVIEKFNYTPGNKVYFKFGGEDNITVVKPDGTPISIVE